MSEVKKKLYRSYSIRLPKDISIEEAVAELKGHPDVEYAEPSYLFTTLYVPSSNPKYSQQWAHQKTQAENGWDIERGDPNIVIAIIDTGVDYNHEDLADNIWRDGSGNPGKDFVDIDVQTYIDAGYQLISGEDYTGIDGDPSDYNGHGTHCAGIAAAVDNDKGVVGAAHNCKIMPVRAGFSITHPSYGEVGLLDTASISSAMQYAADSGAKVISMSFGGSEVSTPIINAINYAYSQNVTLVAAAGNTLLYYRHYPAGYDNVIAVSATARNDFKAWYSTYGYWVDITAPGGDDDKDTMILSTVPTTGGEISDPSGYRSLQGTSMACPYVAGIAGLILSKDNQLNPLQVKQILESGVDEVNVPGTTYYPPPTPPPPFKYYLGTGRVNIYKILQAVDTPPSSSADAQITYPFSNSYWQRNIHHLGEGIIDIKGTVNGTTYTLKLTETPYSDYGTIIGEGNGNIVDGVLASLDTSTLETDKEYFLKLSVLNNIDITDTIQLRYNKYLHPAWPKGFRAIPISYPTIFDLDNDGKQEIISTTYRPFEEGNAFDGCYIYVWREDGTDYGGNWPKYISGEELRGNLAVADIDGDSYGEIVVSTKNDKVYIFSHDGIEESVLSAPAIGSPVLADFDNDGTLEVATGIPGWPDDIARLQMPAVADIDGDDDLELIAGTKGTDYDLRWTEEQKVYVFHSDGSFLDNWPQTTQGWIEAQPAIGDIDNDGDMEIVVVAGGGVYAWHHTGEAVTGWPLLSGSTTRLSPWESPLLADMDGDKDLEVIFCNAHSQHPWLEAYHHDGQPATGWPAEIPYPPMVFVGEGSWVAGDIDADGYLEIVGKNIDVIIAYNHDGSLVNDFPFFLDEENHLVIGGAGPNPTITDLDNDGIVEIVCGTFAGRVFAYNMEGRYNIENMDWPMFAHDAQHTGCYKSAGGDITPPAVSIIYPETEADVPYTGFEFTGQAEDESGILGVWVDVYDYGVGNYTVFLEPASYNSGTNTWSYFVSSDVITPGSQARLSVRAADTAYNMSILEEVLVNVEPDPSTTTTINPITTTTISTVKWVFPASGGAVGQAIGPDGTFYVGTNDWKLYAINPGGTKRWANPFEAEYGISNTPTVGNDGTIYVSAENKLYAINPNKTEKWDNPFQAGGNIRSSVAIGPDGTIYVGSSDWKLYAISPEDGSKMWEFETGGEIISSPAISPDGTIYVGSNDDKLYAIWPDGNKKWDFQTDGDLFSSPAIGRDGTIYVASDCEYIEGKLYAINPDGTEKWSFNLEDCVTNSPVIGSDDTIYIGTEGGESSIFFAINPDGSEKWQCSPGASVNTTAAVGDDNTIYIGTIDGNFYALDGNLDAGYSFEERVKWNYYLDLGEHMDSDPVIGSDGTVYIGALSNDDSHWLFAINNSSSGPADAPWPMFQQNAQRTGRVNKLDSDGDGIPDDGDDSGVAGDAPCTGGKTRNCDDNCPYVFNPGQEDADGDGIGDVCDKIEWEFETSGKIIGQAIDPDGTVYVGSNDGKLYAINPDGTEKWEDPFEFWDGISNIPTVAMDGTIYVSAENKLYAINPDKTEKWDNPFQADGNIRSSVATGPDGTIYVGSSDWKLYAVDHVNGQKKWEFEIGNGTRSSPAVDNDGTIYVGSFDDKLYAVNPDGSSKWSEPFETAGNLYSSPAIGRDGTIYVASDCEYEPFHGRLYAINPDGTEKWSFNLEDCVTNSPVIGNDDTIYIGTQGGESSIFFAINPDGSEKWQWSPGNSITTTAAVGDDNTIYIGTIDGNFYALGSEDGSEKWHPINLGEHVFSEPAIGIDGTVYVGAFISHSVGKLYALTAGSSGPADSPWPMFQQNAQVTGWRGIVINSPEAGESVTIGSTYTIEWGSVGVKGNVKIDLCRTLCNCNWTLVKDGYGNEAMNIPIFQEYFDWTVEGPAKKYCKIRITYCDNEACDNEKVYGESGLFNIVN